MMCMKVPTLVFLLQVFSKEQAIQSIKDNFLSLLYYYRVLEHLLLRIYTRRIEKKMKFNNLLKEFTNSKKYWNPKNLNIIKVLHQKLILKDKDQDQDQNRYL